jgi:hypothetical protein
MFVCCECCVLSGRGLCDELITRPEKSYRLWCVVVCDLETSRMRKIQVYNAYAHSSCVLHAHEWFNLARDVGFGPDWRSAFFGLLFG